MDKRKRRDRSVNFTREETEKLVSLVEIRKQTIENKKSDAITWQDKDTAWKDIEVNFNSLSTNSGVYRDSKHLKLKYEALKRDIRKKSSVVRAERFKTCIGTSSAPPLTPLEQKVKEMILVSVEGGESVFDSDQINNPGPEISEEESCSLIPIAKKIFIPAEIPGNLITAIDTCEIEPVQKKPKRIDTSDVSIPSTLSIMESPPSQAKKWDEWKPAFLEPIKPPVLSKSNSIRTFNKCAEETKDVVQLQKKLLEEEMEQKFIQKNILEEELHHKRKIHELEIQYMIMKNQLLKIEIEKANNK